MQRIHMNELTHLLNVIHTRQAALFPFGFSTLFFAVDGIFCLTQIAEGAGQDSDTAEV